MRLGIGLIHGVPIGPQFAERLDIVDDVHTHGPNLNPSLSADAAIAGMYVTAYWVEIGTAVRWSHRPSQGDAEYGASSDRPDGLTGAVFTRASSDYSSA